MTWKGAVDAFLATHRKTVTAAASTAIYQEGSRMYRGRTCGDQPGRGVDCSMIMESPWRNAKNLTTRVRFSLRRARRRLPQRICWARAP